MDSRIVQWSRVPMELNWTAWISYVECQDNHIFKRTTSCKRGIGCANKRDLRWWVRLCGTAGDRELWRAVVAECGHCQLLLAHPVTQLCGKHALPSLPISPAMEMRIVNNDNKFDSRGGVGGGGGGGGSGVDEQDQRERRRQGQ